jgi:hypothetical protein
VCEGKIPPIYRIILNSLLSTEKRIKHRYYPISKRIYENLVVDRKRKSEKLEDESSSLSINSEATK